MKVESSEPSVYKGTIIGPPNSFDPMGRVLREVEFVSVVETDVEVVFRLSEAALASLSKMSSMPADPEFGDEDQALPAQAGDTPRVAGPPGEKKDQRGFDGRSAEQ